MADSVAAVRGAEEGGAVMQPQASLNLRLAHEEVDRAKTLMADGQNEEADYMALRARADADLALALAREDAARARASMSDAKAQARPSGAPVGSAALPVVLPVVGPTKATQ
jgi:hypothetical protein